MRKYFCLVLFILLTASMPLPADDRGAGPCASRLKTLMQAVELWSNDHRGQFPTKEEWGSPRFAEYVKRAGSRDTTKELKCPTSGKPYLYRSMASNYEIKCPTPEIHGLETLLYSRDRGLVRKTPAGNSPSSTTEAPETAAPTATPAPGLTGTSKTVPPTPVLTPRKGHTGTPAPTPTGAGKKPATPSPAVQAATPKATEKPVSKIDTSKSEEGSVEDRERITGIIRDLYNAYAERNLEKIIEIQHDSIEASALDYQKKKKGTADEVREAFKSATKEIIEHKDFKMLPLNLSDLTFQKKGIYCKVTSVVPIIATERLEVMEEGKYFFVRLRVGELVLEKKNDLWKIVNMYLY